MLFLLRANFAEVYGLLLRQGHVLLFLGEAECEVLRYFVII